MKRIIALLLVMCYMTCSLSMTAFADKTIICPECNKSIPEDSVFCSYCGVKLVSNSISSEQSCISQTPLAIFEGCDDVDQVLKNAEKDGLLPYTSYSSDLMYPNDPGSYSVGYEVDFLGIKGEAKFWMYYYNGFENITITWTSVDKLSSTQSRKMFDEAVSYFNSIFGAPVSESSKTDFANAHWEDTDYMEYVLFRDYNNEIEFSCKYDYPVDSMFKTDSVTQIQSLMQKGLSWSEYAKRAEDIIDKITIS